MKTIAVLTDFSARAEHAARYALHLAGKIKADVLLFHAFSVPAEAAHHGHHTLHSGKYDDLKRNGDKKLSALCKKLESELEKKGSKAAFLPALSYQSEEGVIANAIGELEDNKNIVLMVLATHGTDDASAFMFGDNCRQVIDTATIPLLIVPENASIRNIEKFAFATDLAYNDIAYISSVATLAKYFSADITVANVSHDVPPTAEQEHKIQELKAAVVKEIAYLRVQYRSIPSDSVMRGLDWFIENVNFDVLVMVHRKACIFDDFLKLSVTKKIAESAYVPVLVYPYPVKSLPSF